MYKALYGFTEQPFNSTPDLRFLVPSPPHEEALNQVLYGVRERRGFIRLVGEVGTGKTILCRQLLNELSGEAATAYIFNPFLSRLELLRAVNEDFGIPCSVSDSEKKLIDDLNSFLLKGQSAGRNAVLILDEAQNLSELLLEQVRLLSNLETDREKLLQIVLVGRPELEEKLRNPRLRQLTERIAVSATLRHLTREETAAYIAHRLEVAGGRPDVRFDGGALERVFEYTEGVPRRINLLCDRTLLFGLVKKKGKIDASMIEESSRDLGWRRAVLPKTWRLPDFGRYGPRLIRVVAVAALLAGAAFLGREVVGMKIPAGGVAKLAGLPAASQASGRGGGESAREKSALDPVSIPADGAAAPQVPSASGSTMDSESGRRLQRLWSLRESFRRAVLSEGAGFSSMELADRYRHKSLTATLRGSLPRSIAKPLLMQGWLQGRDRPEFWVVAAASGDALEVYDGKTRTLHWERLHLAPGRPVTLYLFYAPATKEEGSLALGNSGPGIDRLQRQLRELGDYRGPISGVFDEETRAAVKSLQRRYGLSSDGVAGPHTLTLLTYLVGRPETVSDSPAG